MLIKALTLTEPWATLVIAGIKKIETRSWSTNHRGLIAIHAAKSMPAYAVQACREHFIARALQSLGIRADDEFIKARFHLGCILGVVNLEDVYQIKPYRQIFKGREVPPKNPEFAFGDYTIWRYAWMLGEPAFRMPEPIPARGALGLWDYQPETRLTTLLELGG